MEKSLKILEFNIILEKIRAKTHLEASKEELKKLKMMNDPEEIEKALSETDEAAVLLQRMHRFPLYFSSDVGVLIARCSKGGIVTAEELLEVGKFLDTIKANFLYLKTLEENQLAAPHFQERVKTFFYPLELNKRIKEVIDPEGEIKDTASRALRDIRRAIRDCERQIRSKLQEILHKESAKLTSNLISIRNERYVIPVRNDQKHQVPGIIHGQSASGETVFVEPLAVNQLNNRLNGLLEEEEREIARILREISARIASCSEEFLSAYKTLIHLDIVFGKAEYALEIDAKKPRINTEGILELYNCRHPLLNVERVVPNNVFIGRDYQGIIITGPNTGGKTVLLKTVGLLSLMVKYGLLVPCDEESQIMIFDKVLADIGDEQSIDQNLSTFSAHLKNVISIINAASEESLVLLDELGSGTDPAEGSALAIAIFEHLLSKKCLVIATSHYSELKLYAYRSENVINASVEFDVNTLQPTYKLLLGIPGQSNALKISRMLGLSEEIIQKAESYAYERSDDFGRALDKLLKQTRELERLQKQTKEKEKNLSVRLAELDFEREELRLQKNEILKQAEEEARALISESEAKLNKLFDDLEAMKERAVKGHEVAEAKHRFRMLKAEAKAERESTPEETEFKAGESVFLERFGAYGIILSEKKNNKFDVQIGNATVTVSKKEIRHAEAGDAKTSLSPRTNRALAVKKDVSMTLDLRGKRYEEAKIALEKFIDDALFGALAQVNIIHGFGTGIIREMVHNYLKKSEFVESFRFGGANEGGRGVTVVNLKK